MPMFARHLSLLLALACFAGETSAQKHLRRADDPDSAARRDAARTLADRIASAGTDPRREADGLVTAARAASLAWKLDADFGRKLFDRTVRRTEALLSDDSQREATVRALPAVLANLAARDPDAAMAAVDRLAEAAKFGAAGAERARVYASIANAIAGVSPAAADRFVLASFEITGTEPTSWSAVRALDETAAARAIDRGFTALEHESPRLDDLFVAATFGEILVFGSEIELGPNARPEIVRRWLALAVRRLDALRAEIVDARASGRVVAVPDREAAIALAVGPQIVVAVTRWYPEGLDVARAALFEVLLGARGGAAPAAGAPGAGAGPASSDDARIDAAYDFARDELEAEARSSLAAVQNPEAKAAASDDVELIFAGKCFDRGDWSGLGRRLGRVADPALRVRATGLVAATLSTRRVFDIAERYAADALRLGARAPHEYATVAGLLDAAIAFERLGDPARAHDALAHALAALDRMEAEPSQASGCRCWPFVPTAFEGTTVSAGLQVGPSDLRLVDVLAAAARRDLVGALGAVSGLENIQARETAQLALLRALVE
jgi:hypothetical protein